MKRLLAVCFFLAFVFAYSGWAAVYCFVAGAGTAWFLKGA